MNPNRKERMIEHWRGVTAQVMGAVYLATTSWTDILDVLVKTLVGVFMMVLLYHQIMAMRRRKRYVEKLETMVRRAKVRCTKAARGQCWLLEEAEATIEKDKEMKA